MDVNWDWDWDFREGLSFSLFYVEGDDGDEGEGGICRVEDYYSRIFFFFFLFFWLHICLS